MMLFNSSFAFSSIFAKSILCIRLSQFLGCAMHVSIETLFGSDPSLPLRKAEPKYTNIDIGDNNNPSAKLKYSRL